MICDTDEFCRVKSGCLKKEQIISGKMADQFGNLYMAISVKYYAEKYNIDLKMDGLCCGATYFGKSTYYE